MKVWPIDPLVPRNLRLEVPEKLMRGSFSSKSHPLMGGATLPNCGESLRAQATAARGREAGRAPGVMTSGMVTTPEIGPSAAKSPPDGGDAVHRLNGSGSIVT